MHSKIRTYSKGMKQRLGIAQALFHDPEVIFLDEPTDGVDPVGRSEIRELMRAAQGRGPTIFLNSHLLGEVEMICDRVAILQQGRGGPRGDGRRADPAGGAVHHRAGPGQAFPADEVARLGYAVGRSATAVRGRAWPTARRIDPVLRLLLEQGLSLRHMVEKKQRWKTCSWRRSRGPSPGWTAGRGVAPARDRAGRD